MTLSALLTMVRKSLRSFGVANPDVEAETIISHVLGLSRSEVYLEPARAVAGEDQARILDIVAERRRRFPLQYLLGEIEFMGLPFRITEGVFVPRPETEILVETVIGRAGALGERLRILDLATGSGVVAVSLAKYLPAELVVATDLSQEAAGLARQNAFLNGVGDAVLVAVGDGLDFIRRAGSASGRAPRGGAAPCRAAATVGGLAASRQEAAGQARVFDIVVSNPPYVETGEISMLQPEVRDYEPRVALDGGRDGLSFIAGVVPEIPSILKEGGVVAFEIGATQADRVRALFAGAGLAGVEVLKDLAGRDRIAVGVKPAGL